MIVFCRLALAMVVGTLQSLGPATPNAIGASFLHHHVYRNIHNETLDNFDNIQDFYHSGLDLGALAEADFSWWGKALKTEWFERASPAKGFCTLGQGVHGVMGVEVEVEVEVTAVELLNGCTQELEPSLRWKHGWVLGMGMYTALPPIGENSVQWTCSEDNEVTYNIYKKGLIFQYPLHLLLQQLTQGPWDLLWGVV
jgi:hypothetical protein